MSFARKFTLTAGTALLCCTSIWALEPVKTPRPIPLTRPEMKQLLEDMKSRKLRFPLPELTEEDKKALGDRVDSYEARLRYHYMPAGESSVFGFGGNQRSGSPGNTATPPANAAGNPPPARDFTRNSDPKMTLSYPFKTMLFWIVSRTNNCQYCLGHQEQKLSAAGLSENDIASLDVDWGHFPPAQQLAFAYARKLTYEPHLLSDEDIATLKTAYTDLQILEMTLSVSGNNAINRWKEGSGVPQSKSGMNFFRRREGEPAKEESKDRPQPIESFLTPTDEKFQNLPSKVATLEIDPTTGKPTRTAVSNRPKLESREVVEKALAAARKRAARLPLVSEEEARAALGENAPKGKVPAWIRLMANFPVEANSRYRSLNAMYDDRGDLSPLLKAQVSWIIARQDRAWYATSQAQQRLHELGWKDDQIFTLDGDWNEFTPAEQALFKFAQHLAATPVILTDEDAAEALATNNPRQVVQLINYVTGRVYFDRVTEAAGLPVE